MTKRPPLDPTRKVSEGGHPEHRLAVMKQGDAVKVYKVELLIVDHDALGPDEVRVVLENAHYPNHCIRPQVASVEEREVEWNDDHPLNRANWIATFRKMFGGPWP